MISKLVVNTLKIIFISAIVSLTFYAYLQIIGIPKTQARNYYNLGEQALGKGDVNLAKEYLEKAMSYWPEGYIRQELQKISN